MPNETPPPSLLALFAGFMGIGVCGFGGVLPWARRMVVEQRRWLTAAEFADMLGLCQFLPGPNVVNVSIALGARFHGPLGSAFAFTGLMAAPMAIVLGLGLIYARFADLPQVQHAFVGLGAVASGLLLATALKIAAPLRLRPVGIVVMLAIVVAIAWFRWPLPTVLAVMAPVSVGLTHWFER